MSPRPDLGPKPRLGYTASLIERAAERRTDAAALAALEKDARARAYVIGGEMVVLNKGGGLCTIRCSRWRRRARWAVRRRSFFSACSRARRALRSRSIRRTPRRSRRATNFVVTDLRSIAVRGLVAADHLPPLAEGKALLTLARAPSLLLELRGCQQCRRGGLAARLSVLPHPAFPPHRSGRDHASGRGRALRARPLASVPGRHVVVPRRLHRAGRSDRRCRAAGNPRGGRHRLRPRDAISPPSPGPFPPR